MWMKLKDPNRQKKGYAIITWKRDIKKVMLGFWIDRHTYVGGGLYDLKCFLEGIDLTRKECIEAFKRRKKNNV